jgi:hypothetical protein
MKIGGITVSEEVVDTSVEASVGTTPGITVGVATTEEVSDDTILGSVDDGEDGSGVGSAIEAGAGSEVPPTDITTGIVVEENETSTVVSKGAMLDSVVKGRTDSAEDEADSDDTTADKVLDGVAGSLLGSVVGSTIATPIVLSVEVSVVASPAEAREEEGDEMEGEGMVRVVEGRGTNSVMVAMSEVLVGMSVEVGVGSEVTTPVE